MFYRFFQFVTCYIAMFLLFGSQAITVFDMIHLQYLNNGLFSIQYIEFMMQFCILNFAILFVGELFKFVVIQILYSSCGGKEAFN